MYALGPAAAEEEDMMIANINQWFRCSNAATLHQRMVNSQNRNGTSAETFLADETVVVKDYFRTVYFEFIRLLQRPTRRLFLLEFV